MIDVKAFRVESAREVADRLQKILTFMPPERVWVNPDCGLWETPRRIAAAKLKAMVDGARLVRAGRET